MDNLKWKILESEHIIKDRWISLRADKCQMPNGRIVEPYYVLESQNYVNVVALTEANQIVLVRQYRHGLRESFLELPCGIVEKNDSSPLETIRRELAEETGYRSDDIISTGINAPNPARYNNLDHYFLARNAKKVSEQKLDETEQIDIVLRPFDEILNIIDRGEIMNAMHVASIFMALRKLGKI